MILIEALYEVREDTIFWILCDINYGIRSKLYTSKKLKNWKRKENVHPITIVFDGHPTSTIFRGGAASFQSIDIGLPEPICFTSVPATRTAFYIDCSSSIFTIVFGSTTSKEGSYGASSPSIDLQSLPQSTLSPTKPLNN